MRTGGVRVRTLPWRAASRSPPGPGCELSSITRSPHRARERLLFGRRRLVRDRSAPEVIRELHGACAVPYCFLK